MENQENSILIKMQEIETFLLTAKGEIENVLITVKNYGEKENCITIGKRDLFFDKEGNFTGDGMDLRSPKTRECTRL